MPPAIAPSADGLLLLDCGSAEGKSDVFLTVKALMDSVHGSVSDPSIAASVTLHSVELHLARLKHLLDLERHESSPSYALAALHHRSRSERRKSIETLHGLIRYLESQVRSLQDALALKKARRRHGLHHYVASISEAVLFGSSSSLSSSSSSSSPSSSSSYEDVVHIGRAMEVKLRSWLDQQSVRELARLIDMQEKQHRSRCGSAWDDDSQDRLAIAIALFERSLKKGFDASLQDAILSSRLVDKLVALLEPSAAMAAADQATTVPWKIQRQSVLALLALAGFNKDVFLSMLLMSNLLHNLLASLDMAGDRLLQLELLLIFKGLLSAGEECMADGIHSQNGVPRLVELLDHESAALQHAAMECVLELAYHGTMEVVEQMLELEVIKKLESLQRANAHVVHARDPHMEMLLAQIDRGPAEDHYPFTDAVMKFTLHFALGTGLRQRERRALKQEVIKQIKDIVDDDVQSANLTTDILWVF